VHLAVKMANDSAFIKTLMQKIREGESVLAVSILCCGLINRSYHQKIIVDL
jgi:hypothetical protein